MGSFGLAKIISQGHKISTLNSRNTVITPSNTFTGEWENVSKFAYLALMLKTDQNSATGGFKLQFSSDGVNIDIDHTHTYTAADGTFIETYSLHCKYFRVVYVNGAGTQTYFRLSVKLFTHTGTELHILSDEVAGDDRASLTKSVLIAQSQDMDWHAVGCDENGNLLVTSAGQALATRKGFKTGRVTSGLGSANEIPVRSTTYTEQSSNAQRSFASASASDTSAGTGARTIRLTYLAADFTGPFTEDITLNGTSSVNTVASNICYVERIEVLTVGSGGTNAGIITMYAATAGGGGAMASIAANAGDTLYCHHYVPIGYRAFVTGLSGFLDSAKNSAFFLRALQLNVTNAYNKLVSDLVRSNQSGSTSTSTTSRTYGTPIEVTGPARIVMYVKGVGSSTTFFNSFDFYELPIA